MERLGRVGLVARFKPVHVGHAVMIESIVARADSVRIGIGSSNKYDVQNPFTAAESAEMISLVPGGASCDLVEVPDLGNGPRWREMVKGMFGELDLFVTANDYVRSLLEDDYPIAHPSSIVPRELHVAVDGTMVRRAMARGDDWQAMVTPKVTRHLIDRGLVDRFRREFGLATLALDAEA